MTKTMKITTKLGLGGIAACGICCAPIIASLFVGIGAVGMLTMGQWLIAIILMVMTLYFMIRFVTHRKCKSASNAVADNCGCQTSCTN